MAGNFGFDIAAGMSQSTLNALMPQVYNAIYPDFLKGTINVSELDISSVDFDIQAPPTVTLQPSESAKAHIAASIDTLLTEANLKTQAVPDKFTLLGKSSSATFTATAPKVALTVNYKSKSSLPTVIPSASLTADAMVSVDSANSDLTLQLLKGTVNIPKNPVLTQLLNKGFVPSLIDYLNKNIFSSIKIPQLQYKSLKVSAPLPVVRQSYLTAFSDLGTKTPAIPGPLPWPEDHVYIAVDSPTLEAAARLIFPIGPNTGFNWDIVSGQVGATVNPPTVSSINADGSISASIEAQAECHLTLHTPRPLPNVSFGPSASATASATFRTCVQSSEVIIQLKGSPNFQFSFTWGIPGWINWFFKPIEEGLALALNNVLGPLIVNAIPEIPVYTIPDIPINLDNGKKIKIAIDNATPRGFGFQNSLLLVAAEATVSQ